MKHKQITGILLFALLFAVGLGMGNFLFGEAAGAKVSNPESVQGDTLWDCVCFGVYYEDGQTEVKKPIKWRVLSVKGQDAFLISDKILDAGAFHDAKEAVTWKDSYLRAWLNGGFYHCAFSEEEKQAIIKTKVVTENNPDYGTSGKEVTEDYVYLLSAQEAMRGDYGFSPSGYYGDGRAAENTAYAATGGTQGKNMRAAGKNDWWWLRSPGFDEFHAAQVMETGYLANYGSAVDFEKCGIRPALHLDLSKSSVWTYAGKTNLAGEQILVKEPEPNPNPNPNPGKNPPKKVKAPKRVVLQSVKKSGKKILVKWKKTSCDGYQILISIDKKFKKNKKSISVHSAKTPKKTIKPWKGNCTYYVKVRAYRKSGKTKVYGTYSRVRKVKFYYGKKK